MEKRIALVTCSKYPNLSESDRVLAIALQRLGAVVSAIDWRDGHVTWADFDLAVVRSTWDYHLYPDEFAAWIDSVDRATRLINSSRLVRWNSNKRYLSELAERIPLLPFLLVQPGGVIPYRDLDHSGWRDLVLKPLVGASAWQIVRTPVDDLESVVTPELSRSGYLIQPFAPDVLNGEYSLVFFDGAFSHAVLKKPRSDDFRSQQEHGAHHQVINPAPKLISEAAAVLNALPEPPAYARIDGIVQNGRFVLMEAELIEPELFFQLVPDAAETFSQSILELV